jgi:tetratricopeptide (TPR) repeat protein
LAGSYHQIGILAQERGRLAEAEDWYRQSLTIKEELGDRPRMAATYHQLGILAQERGRLAEAEDWYRQSLTITEELGNRPRMATSYGQLGLLAEARGQPGEALAWTIRCVALFDEFPHPSTGPGPRQLARLAGLLGRDMLDRAWTTVTGTALPRAVAAYLDAHHSDPDPGGQTGD